MRCLTRTCSVVILLLGWGGAWGEEPGLPEVQALQDLVQKALARAEPSIACILVSRSDSYTRWHAAPSAEQPGRLGRFVVPPPSNPLSEEDRLKKAHDLSNPETIPEAYGSGVVVDVTGLVLTMNHVVRGATKVFVRLPGGQGSWADIHAADPRSDLAVLRLLDPPRNLKPLPLGDGNGLRKGQFVLCLANPFAAGFRDGSPSASWGIISNLRRRAPLPAHLDERQRARLSIHQFGTLIQTDVRLNVGCSGGALLNLRGELIALTTSLAGISGGETPGGYAIPLDTGMRKIIDVLREGREVEYGFLGVRPQAEGGRGVLLGGVIAGSPAQLAGLRQGDLIVSIDGQPVQEVSDLFRLVGTHLAGSTVGMEVMRGSGKMPQTFLVKLAKFYAPGPVIASNRPAPLAGLRVDDTSVLAQRDTPVNWIPQGVAIREVVRDSPADRARLQVDKVITQVNDQLIRTPTDFYRAMEKAEGPIHLTVQGSDGRPERVTLPAK